MEIDQEIQNTEDFSVESNDQEIDDSTTENSSIIVEQIELKDALKSIDVNSKFYSVKMPSEEIKSSIFRLMDDLENRNLYKRKVRLKITDFFQ